MSTAEGVITLAHKGAGEQVRGSGLAYTERTLEDEASGHKPFVTQDAMQDADGLLLPDDFIPVSRTM